MDYTIEMKRGILEATIESNNCILARMESESDMIIACFEMTGIIPEIETVLEANNTGNKSFLVKIREFFKNIFNVFMNKAKELFSRNDAWINENKEKLLKMNLDGFKISTIPYWNTSFNDIKSFFNETLNSLFSNIRNILNRIKINVDAKRNNGEKMKFEPLNKFKPKEGSITDGYKNYLRHGSIEPPKHVEISGSKLKSVVKDAVEYCSTYNKTIVPYLKSQLSHIDSEIRAIESKISSIKESTIFIEDAHICESELSFLPGFEVIREVEEKKSNVVITKPENDDKNNNTNTHKGEEVKTSYDNKSKAELRYIEEGLAHTKLILTSAMTVCEEKYNAYMKILRGLAPNAHKEKVEDTITKIKR